ncbi:hypothetical protein Taro_024268 [Colocasia esculenta]|uniref:Uncharacterized protein n=1 Tax=Colocasia esculenta TaxID=4460 RepID=A0A843VGZ6_COLES|nr:hypothetical protein [Colocasia esculenta]
MRGDVASWTLRRARRRWPTDVKGPIGVRSSVWAAPRWSIPSVCLSTGVATAGRVATPEEASSQWGVTLSRRGCLSQRVFLSRRAALARQGAIAVHFPVAMHVPQGWPALGTFRWGTRQVAWLRSVTEGDTFVAMSWRRCLEGRMLSPLPGTPILGSLLREYSGLRACSSWQPSWRTLEQRGKRGLDSGAESFLELSCLGRDAEVIEAVLFPARARLATRGSGWCVLLLAAGSGSLVAVVVTTFPHDVSKYYSSVVLFFGASLWWHRRMWLPDLAVCQGSGVVLFVGPRPCRGLGWPCLRGSSSRELCVRQVAEAAVAPCIVSSSESECCELLYLSELRVVLCKFSGVPGGGLGGRVVIVVWGFPASFMCTLQCVAVVATSRAWRVWSLGVRAVVARLAVDSLAVVFPVWRMIAGKSRHGALHRLRCSVCHVASLVERYDTCLWLLTVGCSFLVAVALPSRLRCIAWLPYVLGLRCAVGLAGAFWRVFPEQCLGGSGGGSSQDRPLSLLAEVLPRTALCLFRATVVLPMCCHVDQVALLFVSEFLDCVGGTSCVPVVRAICFVPCARCALADGGLSLVALRVFFLCFSLVARGGDAPLWCCVARVRIVSGEESFLLARGVSAAGAPVALSVVRQALVVACVLVFPLDFGASVFGCGTLLCWHIGTRAELCVRVAGVLPTLVGSLVVTGVGESGSRWRSLLSVRLVTVRPIGLLVLDHESELLTDVSRVAVGNCVLCQVLLATEFLTRRVALSRLGCRRLKALAGDPFPLFPSFRSLLSLRRCSASSSSLCVFQARRRAVRGAVASWTLRGARRRCPTDVKGPIGGVVAVLFPVAMGWIPLGTFRWGTRQVAWLRSVTEGDTFVVVSWRRCQESLRLSPLPETPILGSLLREYFELRACSSWTPRSLRRFSSRRGPYSLLSHCLSLRWFQSHVVVLGVGPQLGQAAVLRAFVCSVAALSLSSTEVRGESQAGDQREWLVCPPLGCRWRWLGCPRGSSSRELGVGRVAEVAVAPYVVSSSESECCEEEGRKWCRGIVKGPIGRSFFVKVRGRPGMEHPVGLPLYWCRDRRARHDTRRGVGPVGRDHIVTQLLVTIRVAIATRFPVATGCCRDALPRRNRVAVVVLFPVAMGRLALRTFCQKFGVVLLCLPRLFARCLALEGLSRSEVVSVAWDPHPREPSREVSGLRECSSWQPTGRTLELRGKRGLDSGAKSFVELSCLGLGRRGRLEFFPSRSWVPIRGGTGACGFPTSWCVRGLGWFCLLALDLVEVWGGRACGVRLPCKFHMHATVCCTCCCIACVASVVARCVRAVVARLAVDSLVVVFPMFCVPCCIAGWCLLVVSSGELLSESFSVGSGGKPFVVVLVRVSPKIVPCSFLSVAVLPQGLREPLWFSLPVRLSRCSVFCVLFGADVVVVLLKLLAFYVFPMRVSGLGPAWPVVLFQACGSLREAFGSFCGSACVWCPCRTTGMVWVRPSGDSGCRFRVLRVLRVHLLSLLDREEGLGVSRVAIGNCVLCRVLLATELKALVGDPFPLFPSFPSLLSLWRCFTSPSSLCVFQARRRIVRAVMASWTLRGARRRWQTNVKGPIGGSFFVKVCGRPEMEHPVGLPLYWCRDRRARRDTRRGVGPVGRDLIAMRLPVPIRVAVAMSFPVETGFLSRCATQARQGGCRSALSRRDGVATT